MAVANSYIFKMNYHEEINKAMKWLSKKKDVVFMGQTVSYPGSSMYNSLKSISKKKKIELPVFENTQMGMSIGMALKGYVPVSVFPRMDFLICAMDQLVNHLDKIYEMSGCEFTPGVIIRTQVGATEPLWPGLQHCQDHSKPLDKMLDAVHVKRLKKPEDIFEEYQNAYIRASIGQSTILVEYPQSMNKKQWEKIQNVK